MPYEKRLTAWQRLVADLPMDKLDETTNVVPFDDLLPLSKDIIKGQVRGRTVIDVNA